MAATLWLLAERPDIDPERELPTIIRSYNESVGGINDDTQGYHETITFCFLAAIRRHLARTDPGLPLVAKVNRLLAAAEGRRDWPLRFYSRELLFSPAARRAFVPPDLVAWPGRSCIHFAPEVFSRHQFNPSTGDKSWPTSAGSRSIWK